MICSAVFHIHLHRELKRGQTHPAKDDEIKRPRLRQEGCIRQNKSYIIW
jgi:hypothetical protein